MTGVHGPARPDPYLWLEEVSSARALSWVREQSDATRRELEARPGFDAMHRQLRAILDAQERIPYVVGRAGYYYNFWQDDAHVRGIWRRTTPQEYVKPQPHWDVLLDVDALAAAENESWVWQGSDCLYPDFERCLIRLSRGGGDSHVVREFDARRRAFVADGFVVPEAKSDVGWIDADTLYVGSDFGEGSLTDSGYARTIRRWVRGTALAAAPIVFEAERSDVGAGAAHVRTWVDGAPVWHDLLTRQTTFFTSEQYLVRAGQRVRLAVPDDATVSLFADQILVQLRSDWPVRAHGPVWPQGALLVLELDAFLDGSRDFTVLFSPGERRSLANEVHLKNALLIHELDELRSHLYRWVCEHGTWQRSELAAPEFGQLSIGAVDPDRSDDFFVITSGPLRPATLELRSGDDPPLVLKSEPSLFDAHSMEVAYYNARSRDGTSVPYAVVTPAGFTADGRAPTLLYGYGGFEVSLLPLGYSAALGVAWLALGGVYVEAGLRGGGEFGPAWHQAAMREHKQSSYDDMIAVAEDLIARCVTSPAHLGIEGRSNGGLMVAAVMLQRPELFRAVVCQAPLLDMRRFHLLLAGASWVGEYGNPDNPEDWAFISKYSPYDNIRDKVRYPRMLLATSTSDDRVHPGHARKLAARLAAQGSGVLYYENTEGGHAGSADNAQRAYMDTLAYTFLLQELR